MTLFEKEELLHILTFIVRRKAAHQWRNTMQKVNYTWLEASSCRGILTRLIVRAPDDLNSSLSHTRLVPMQEKHQAWGEEHVEFGQLLLWSRVIFKITRTQHFALRQVDMDDWEPPQAFSVRRPKTSEVKWWSHLSGWLRRRQGRLYLIRRQQRWFFLLLVLIFLGMRQT